jgi:glyceraldehyde-3-phosphate dehydrogenase (NADP+)
VSAITPFNFPLNLVAHKLGPALAAGDTVVLKPSSNAPGTALKLARLIASTGLPQGTVSILPCLSGQASQLVEDDRLKLLTFTGSPAVGWGLKSRAGKKRVVLELGGNAGVILDESADLEFALKRLVGASYGNAGQSCIAVQRIFVHDALFGPFLQRFVKLSQSVAVGDPFDERTVVGPMITEEAARQVESWIREATTAGARILCGGKRRGALLEPTVLVDVTPSMKVCSHEVFAPVVTVEKFSDFADAVKRVNNSAFGLQAGVFTNNFRNVFHAYRELEVGGVIINDTSAYRMDHMPYGGVKDSGFGREGVRYAIEEMTEMKLLGMNLS